MSSIDSAVFTEAVVLILDEAFDNVHGFFLDKNTSFFETLADISATQASVPVGGKCATLAAQVKHVAFYLEVVEKSVRNPDSPQADWDEIWRTTSRVTEAEWAAIQAELRSRYDDILRLIEETPVWPKDMQTIGSVMAVIAHTAYHLGEIRQALCTLR